MGIFWRRSPGMQIPDPYQDANPRWRIRAMEFQAATLHAPDILQGND
jgi:hypothetical protein